MKNKYKKIYTLAHKSEYRNYTVRDLLDLKGKKVRVMNLIRKWHET